jgi:prefoldin subunit 5
MAATSSTSDISPERVAIARHAYNEAIAQAESELTQLRAFDKDYAGLSHTLRALQEKSRHRIRVPFGPVASFAGYLHHTNEVNVHLGADYYVERSVPQARRLLDRRRAALQEKLATGAETLDGLHAAVKASHAAATGGMDLGDLAAAAAAAAGSVGSGAASAASTGGSGADAMAAAAAATGVHLDKATGKKINEDGDEVCSVVWVCVCVLHS